MIFYPHFFVNFASGQKAEREPSMMIHRLKISGLLSFGPQGIDLPMEPLNVLIGPNGSGKSNLLEVLALLHAAPRELAEPIKRGGGIWEWLWKGDESPGKAILEAFVNDPEKDNSLRHVLEFTDHGGRFEVADERIECAETEFAYRLHQGQHTFDIQTEPKAQRTSSSTVLSGSASIVSESLGLNAYRERTKPEESVLSQVRDAQTYPALYCLQEQYERIRLYRNWSFGPTAELRRNQSTHDPSDFLNEGGANLALVLSHFQGENKRKLVAALRELFDGIVDINCPVTGGTVSLFLEEQGGRQIPASRLSDGTLRYLCLLAILLHPEPPSLVAIEEPELGLHPDLLPTLSDLLVQASKRSQLIVTTHSDVLVDALTDKPESIVVCEKHVGQTAMQRLDKDELTEWLEEYSLGDLWTSGQLGGNRW